MWAVSLVASLHLVASAPLPGEGPAAGVASSARAVVTEAPAPRAAGPRGVRPGGLQAGETARYHVRFGAFGKLGEIALSLAAASPDGHLHAVGMGTGSLLGLGSTEKRIETELDADGANALRWTITRVQDGKTIVDHVAQSSPGQLELLRERDGQRQAAVLSRGRDVLDPVALLLRLRFAPPAASETFEVLDGRLLWLVTVGPPRVEQLGGSAGTRALRFDARASPVGWDGLPDGKRTARTLALYVTDDVYRLPLRITMPVGPSLVEVDLVALERARPAAERPSWLARPGRWLGPLGRAFARSGNTR